MKIKNVFLFASCYFFKKKFVYRLYEFFGFIFISSPDSKSRVKLKLKKTVALINPTPLAIGVLFCAESIRQDFLELRCPPWGRRGFKSRMRPPYPQRVVKGD